MLCRLIVVGFCLAVSLIHAFDSSGATQRREEARSNNECVNCHAKASESVLINRYLDWHFSPHRDSGVGCDKCHGGDSAAREKQLAHKGIASSSLKESRLSLENLPETCGACHKAIANSFVESVHYQTLKRTGLGPSCNTCHNHMASSVARFPSDAATYCIFCHNSINSPFPQKPEIPAKAKVVMEFLGRASYGIKYAQDLLKAAQARNLDVAEQAADMKLLQQLLYEARVGWHAFNLDGVRVKSEKAFDESLRIRDQLTKKIERVQ